MVSATQIGTVELRIHDIGGLSGQDDRDLDLKIVNPQKEVFAVEGVRLRTNGQEYTAKAMKVDQCCADPDELTPDKSSYGILISQSTKCLEKLASSNSTLRKGSRGAL